MALSVAGKRDWSLTHDSTSDFFPSKKPRINIKRNISQTTMEDQYEELLEWKARFASLSSKIQDMQDLNDLQAAGIDPLATFDEVANDFPFLVCSSDEDFEDAQSGVLPNKLKTKSRSVESPDSVSVDVASSPLSSASNDSSPMIPEEEFVVDMEGIAGDGVTGAMMEVGSIKKSYELLPNDELIYTITNLLSNEKLKRVLDIVSESNAPLDTNDSGEVEFDLSLLDGDTLLKLNEYVSGVLASGSAGEESSQLCYNNSLAGQDESSVSSPPEQESYYSQGEVNYPTTTSRRHRPPISSSSITKSKCKSKSYLVDQCGMDESSPDVSPIKPKTSTQQPKTSTQHITHHRTQHTQHITQAKLLDNPKKSLIAQSSKPINTTSQQRKRKRSTSSSNSKSHTPTQSKIIKSLSSSSTNNSNKKTKEAKAKGKSKVKSKQTKSATSVTKRNRSTNSKLTNSSSITNIVTTNVIYLEPCRPRKEGGELFIRNQILTVNNSIEDDEEEIDIC